MNRCALLAVMLGVVTVTLDISLTSTALPSIALGIGVPAPAIIWIVNVYYLAVIAALLPLAALGEIYGHRRVFIGGLFIFALGSLASGLAGTLETLMAGRAFLGIGSAAISATTPALIRSLYPPERLARGLGLYAMAVGIAFTIGPTAASGILAVVDWQWLFLQGVPVAGVALALAVKQLPATDMSSRRFDISSATLCAVMLASLLFGIAGMAHLGWKPVIAAFAASAIAAFLLHKRESGSAAPILAMDLFRIRLFSLSAATAICAFAVQGLMVVVLPFLLTFELGYTQTEVGLLITPWSAALAFMTLIAAPLSNHIAPGLLGAVGLAILAAGLASLATMPEPVEHMDIVGRLVLCGVGFGFFQSPNMVALMASAPRERSGSAGGILATARLLGQAIGAAAVAFCLSRWPQGGVLTAIWFGVSLAVLGALISVLRLFPMIRQR